VEEEKGSGDTKKACKKRTKKRATEESQPCPRDRQKKINQHGGVGGGRKWGRQWRDEKIIAGPRGL